MPGQLECPMSGVEKENHMSKRPIIIDTDPGIDDALAIAIALFSEELDVKDKFYRGTITITLSKLNNQTATFTFNGLIIYTCKHGHS